MKLRRRVDGLVVVALAEEFESVRDLAGDTFRPVERGDVAGYDYELQVGTATPPLHLVASLIGEMGTDRAATHTSRLLERWNPQIVTVVGISAGTIDDVALGDVVVADQVDAYLSVAKAAESPTGFDLEHRGRVLNCDDDVVEEARHLRFSRPRVYREWQQRCRPQNGLGRKGELPRLHVAHIASGPILSAADSFLAWLKSRDSKVFALDMESAGVVAAAREKGYPALAVRGISDRGDAAKKKLDSGSKGEIRKAAMRNAFEMTTILLSRFASLRKPKQILERGRARAKVRHKLEVTPASDNLVGKVCDWICAPPINPKQLAGMRVLHVEDEENIVRSLRRILRRTDVVLIGAAESKAALEYIQHHEVDAAIVDFRLPGLSGTELCAEIRCLYPNLPILMLTGLGDATVGVDWGQTDRRSVFPCLGYTTKPWIDSEIVERLAALVCDPSWAAIWHESSLFGSFFPRLFDCKRMFCETSALAGSDGLVSQVLRHKARADLACFKSDLRSGSVEAAIDKFYSVSMKVMALADLTRRAETYGLVDFLKAYSSDLGRTYRSLELDIEISGELRVRPAAVQVLLLVGVELIDNAREALKHAGRIHLRASRWETHPDRISLTVTSNSGPLHPKVRSRMFEAGFSTKGKNRGNGLSLLRRLVERADGSLTCSTRGDQVEFSAIVQEQLCGSEPEH